MLTGHPQLSPLRITLIYLIVSVLWVVFSDRLLILFMPEATGETLTFAQTLKGWLFIAGSALLIGYLTQQLVRDLTQAQSELRLRQAAMAKTHTGVIIAAEDQTILYVNEAFTRITGFSADYAVGRTPRILNSGFHDGDFYRTLWGELESEGVWQGEIVNRKADGSLFTEWITITRVADPSLDKVHYVSVLSDISEQKEGQEKLRYMAYYDPLTELPNRAFSQEEVRRLLTRATGTDYRLCLMFVDLDNFKVINESLGHEAGDQLLREVAIRLREALGADGFIGRFAGDVFVVCSWVQPVERAGVLARAVLGCFDQTFHLEPHRDLSVRASIGITLTYGNEAGADEEISFLFSCADSALNEAKRRGRNTYAFYTQALTEGSTRRLELEQALKEAIDDNQLVLFYQPVFDVENGHCVGAEALVRWEHPERGMISPGTFIPLAEDTGLILPLGRWVMEEVAGQVRAWLDQGLDPGRISFNVSSQQLHNAPFVEQLQETLQTMRVPAGCLEVELTESGLMAEETIGILNRIRDIGVDIAIDDFGTGYSSLAYLRRFPVEKLKIDRGFVEGLEDSPEARSIVEGVVAMAQALALRTQAEGVETREQLAVLSALGAECYQGFLRGRPVPAETYTQQWLTTDTRPFISDAV
ncbi:MAG: putative bifunctional diguanylate cyclase/phosphodiesterase [Pseudomonadota bacterium]